MGLVGGFSHPKLPRAGWLGMVLTCATQLRPIIKPELLETVPGVDEEPRKTWARLTDVTLGATKKRGMDPQFVKFIRTLKEVAHLGPEKQESS